MEDESDEEEEEEYSDGEDYDEYEELVRSPISPSTMPGPRAVMKRCIDY